MSNLSSQMSIRSLFTLMNEIEEDQGRIALKGMYSSLVQRFEFYPASRRGHHAWAGGLHDHTVQIYLLMKSMRDQQELPLTNLSLMTSAILHDVEKTWKYKLVRYESGIELVNSLGERLEKPVHFDINLEYQFPTFASTFWMGHILTRFKVPFGQDEVNALLLSEGGWSPAARADRTLQVCPLAAILHSADLQSARIYGQVKGAGWEKHKWMTYQQALEIERSLPGPLFGDTSWLE